MYVLLRLTSHEQHLSTVQHRIVKSAGTHDSRQYFTCLTSVLHPRQSSYLFCRCRFRNCTVVLFACENDSPAKCRNYPHAKIMPASSCTNTGRGRPRNGSGNHRCHLLCACKLDVLRHAFQQLLQRWVSNRGVCIDRRTAVRRPQQHFFVLLIFPC